MFHPTELMTLVVGNKVVDWTEMEKVQPSYFIHGTFGILVFVLPMFQCFQFNRLSVHFI